MRPPFFVPIPVAAFCAGCLIPALAATAQPAVPTLASRNVPVQIDSGPRPPLQGAVGAHAVYSTLIEAPGAPWVRMNFDLVDLSGDPASGTGAYLLITSPHDGAWQGLNAVHVQEWSNTSAYFNGDKVLVEIISYPGNAPCRLVMSHFTAGEEQLFAETICDTVDDRVLSSDPRVGRLQPATCTAWFINDTNGGLLSAGHCTPGAATVLQFNVPLSTAGGTAVAPPPEDQYAVDAASVRLQTGAATSGNDFAYFGVFANSNTGQMPVQRQGQRFTLAAAAPDNTGQSIRITGYGTRSTPATWNIVQETHAGPYAGFGSTGTGLSVRYRVDTTGGNSGSPVIDESTGLCIGIHAYAGCGSGGAGTNSGTAIQHAPLQAALAAPLGICATGRGTPGGSLFAIGDAANNFGTLSTSNGQFAQVRQVGSSWQGLAYSWRIGRFYAVNSARWLLIITPATGAVTPVAQYESALPLISGLGYDNAGDVLYGISQSDGQLYRIDTASVVATPIGSPQGGSVGALEFDNTRGVLFGIDDATGVSRLVSINTSTGVRTVIGPLGAGISDCNGLAVTANGTLYTIDATLDRLLSINPATGSATVVGPTNGLFGGAYGMSAVIPAPPCRADIATEGSSDPNAGPDGAITGADFDLFVQAFYTEFRNTQGVLIADIAASGSGAPQPDGFVTGEDFDSFVQAYFAGC